MIVSISEDIGGTTKQDQSLNTNSLPITPEANGSDPDVHFKDTHNRHHEDNGP
ncbi:MAG: hypothetical protein IPG87_00445 [Saprospiraceae bacterium]|nr:hypothetical protein [Candidatus Vicinibacter affinis]